MSRRRGGVHCSRAKHPAFRAGSQPPETHSPVSPTRVLVFSSVKHRGDTHAAGPGGGRRLLKAWPSVNRDSHFGGALRGDEATVVLWLFSNPEEERWLFRGLLVSVGGPCRGSTRPRGQGTLVVTAVCFCGRSAIRGGQRDLPASLRRACCPPVPVQVAAMWRAKGAEFEAPALGTLSSAAWGLGAPSAPQMRTGRAPEGPVGVRTPRATWRLRGAASGVLLFPGCG